MTTAREKLFEEMVALAGAPAGPTSEADVKKIMLRYRVQTKPGVEVAPGGTARDTLGDRLLALWRESPPDIKERMAGTIDEFRMQLKGSNASPTKPVARPTRPALTPMVEGDPALPAAQTPIAPRPVERHLPSSSQRLGVGDPPPSNGRAARMGAEPVAGGPRKRGRTRGECPKCHSMGVVLARSYAGDEYFSCIYCGWQAYKPVDDDDPNASLAMRLLGQAPSETPRD